MLSTHLEPIHKELCYGFNWGVPLLNAEIRFLELRFPELVEVCVSWPSYKKKQKKNSSILLCSLGNSCIKFPLSGEQDVQELIEIKNCSQPNSTRGRMGQKTCSAKKKGKWFYPLKLQKFWFVFGFNKFPLLGFGFTPFFQTSNS